MMDYGTGHAILVNGRSGVGRKMLMQKKKIEMLMPYLAFMWPGKAECVDKCWRRAGFITTFVSPVTFSFLFRLR
jgi:hypothetical protein